MAAMDDARFEITEEDILAMLKLLRHISPSQATPEIAIHLLERKYAQIKAAEELQANWIEEMLKDLEGH